VTSSGYDVVESTCCPLLTYVSLPCLGPASVPLADSRLLVVIATCRVWSLDLRHTVAAVLLVAMATAASVNVSVQSRCTIHTVQVAYFLTVLLYRQIIVYYRVLINSFIH